MIELDAIFVGGFRLEDFERPMDGAASQLLQVDAVRTEAFGEAVFGQFGELIERIDAPAFEDLRHFFGERERGDIEIVEIGRDGDAGEIARGEDGGVGGFGDRDVDVRAGTLGDSLRRSDAASRGGAASRRCGRRRCRARFVRTKARKPRRFRADRSEGP